MKPEWMDIIVMGACIGLMTWTNSHKKNAVMLLLVIAIVAAAHYSGICGRV